MNDKNRDWKENTWQIRPELNTLGLDLEAVQFALLPTDPRVQFRKALAKSRSQLRKELGDASDPQRRDLLKQVQMAVMWDRLFKAIPGNQIHLLTPGRSSRNAQVTRSFLISSNAAPGKRWLATRIAYRKGAPTCWSIPVTTRVGRSADVKLRNDNALDIARIYDRIVGAG